MSKKYFKGFNVHYFRTLSEYRELVVDKTIPLHSQHDCPACRKGLKSLYVLSSGSDDVQVRIGQCSNCGYMGYIDRPTKQWMTAFYSSTWDDAERKFRSGGEEIAPKLSALQKYLVSLLPEYALQPCGIACDIGCGKGAVLKALSEAGYERVVGVENSQHRAALTRRNYGHEVIDGDFGSIEVLEKLKQYTRIPFFISSHVFEHIHNVDDAFVTMGSLQQTGDHILLAVPNGAMESPANVVFWLPHLHAFTSTSLKHLFSRHGYEIINTTRICYEDSLVVLGRKTNNPPEVHGERVGNYRAALLRFQSYLRLDDTRKDRKYCFSWRKDTRLRRGLIGSLHFVPQTRILDRIFFPIQSLFKRCVNRFYRSYAKERSFIVSTSQGLWTESPEQNPLLIRYDGAIKLLIK